MGKNPGNQKHHPGKTKAERKRPENRPPDPFRLIRSVIVADQRLRPSCDTQHRRSDQKHVALYNGSSRNQRIAVCFSSVALQHSVQRDQNDAVRGHDQKRGESDFNNSLCYVHLRLDKSQGYLHLLPSQRKKHKKAGGHLGDDSGCCRPRDVHAEGKNKNRIQHNIHHCPDNCGQHSKPREPLSCNEVVHAHGKQSEKGAGSINGQIRIRIRKNIRTGAEPSQKLLF